MEQTKPFFQASVGTYEDGDEGIYHLVGPI
jgi:hypothetical protein